MTVALHVLALRFRLSKEAVDAMEKPLFPGAARVWLLGFPSLIW